MATVNRDRNQRAQRTPEQGDRRSVRRRDDAQFGDAGAGFLPSGPQRGDVRPADRHE